MSNRDPQVPQPGNLSPRPGNSNPWVNLIAFLGVLALGGVLIVLGHITAGSLAATCAALGGLYAAWKHFKSPGG